MEINIQDTKVLIDDEDFDRISNIKWAIKRKPNSDYVWFKTTNKARKTTTMWLHRLIMGVHGLDWKNTIVDHINGNGLDNRKENLRLATACQNVYNSKVNSKNTTGHRGIDIKKGKFRARISFNKKRIELGTFDTMSDAINAYNTAAKLYHGEFSRITKA